MPIATATDMIRNYDLEVARNADPMVREQAARRLEQMYTGAQHDADSIAEALREIFYDEMETMRKIAGGDIPMSRMETLLTEIRGKAR